MGMSWRQILPWVTSATTLWAVWLNGHNVRLSWKVSLANQAFWLVFIVAFRAWGLLPLTLSLAAVFTRHLTRPAKLAPAPGSSQCAPVPSGHRGPGPGSVPCSPPITAGSRLEGRPRCGRPCRPAAPSRRDASRTWSGHSSTMVSTHSTPRTTPSSKSSKGLPTTNQPVKALMRNAGDFSPEALPYQPLARRMTVAGAAGDLRRIACQASCKSGASDVLHRGVVRNRQGQRRSNMTGTTARRRMAAVILLTGTLLGTGAFNPAGASGGAPAPQAASAAKGGDPSEGDREASKKGSFDLTKKGSFDITE